MRFTNRGFTLIELLVVIAIIGILASVVLASLNSARAKGADATIKSSINNARAQAELFYDNNSSAYNGMCTADAALVNITTAVNNAGGSFYCDDNQDGTYLLASQLVSTADYYCVDSTGYAGTSVTNPASPAVEACP